MEEREEGGNKTGYYQKQIDFEWLDTFHWKKTQISASFI